MTQVEVRTRIAPAPSGSIHVGNARTALYNWLFARRHGGSFILRIEDTDATRVSDEHYRAVLEDLRWLGLDWDEGPEVGGPHGPYRQSERSERYLAVATDLVSKGAAYRDYLSPEETGELRKRVQKDGGNPAAFSAALREENARRSSDLSAGYSVRFKVPPGRTITFTDAVRGENATQTDQVPDFVLLRGDGSATYMLAVTVDDALMNINHIIRGEDLMAATPRQLLLREAMGIDDIPVFGHLPLLIQPDGRPLSKRHGDVSVRAYRDRGFLPEAMVNYLALLGWSFDDRTNIFSMDELVEKFSLERVGKNPAAFDVAKLEWLNGHYIRTASPQAMAERLEPFLAREGITAETPEERDRLAQVIPLITERMKRLDEAPAMIRFLFGPVTPDEKATKALAGQEEYLKAAAEALDALDEWSTAAIEGALRSLAEERGLKPKKAFQPIRAAVTGTLVSPPLFESLEILGREETLSRLGS